MLVEKERYLEAGANIGSRRQVKDMEPFIFRVKRNNLAILDIEQTDERLRQAVDILSQYEPEEVLVVSRKPNGHQAVVTFGEALGTKRIFDRFMPGTLTNPESEEYMEPKIVLVMDPADDFQPIIEATDNNLPVIAIADSANSLDYVDFVIPANNKGRESVALLYFILARELAEAWDVDGFDYTVEDFLSEETDDDEDEEDAR